MEMATKNHITKSNISIKKDNLRHLVATCVVLYAFILGRAVHDVVFYAFVGVSLAIFLFSSVSHCFSLLLFLLPFSSILKTNVDGMSFFTILFFIVVLKLLVVKKNIHASTLLSLILFALYCILFSGIGQITTIITMLSGLLMVYCLNSVDVDAKTAIVLFTFGILGASVLALFKGSFPIIEAFVEASTLKLGNENYAVRFAGLHGNPNYYTLDITVLLSTIIVMISCKKNVKILALFLIILSVFGLMSVSKSFLLSWIILMVFWLFISIRQGVGALAKFMFIILIGIAAAYFFAYDYINTFILRFVGGSGTLSEITTGRTDIWKTYINEMFNDPKILFFGNGLNTILDGKGAHNTFLECLFMMGIFGTFLFIIALKASTRQIVSKPSMLIPVIILLVRMMAIGIITYDNLWFYLGLFVVVSKHMKKQKDKEDIT